MVRPECLWVLEGGGVDGLLGVWHCGLLMNVLLGVGCRSKVLWPDDSKLEE